METARLAFGTISRYVAGERGSRGRSRGGGARSLGSLSLSLWRGEEEGSERGE